MHRWLNLLETSYLLVRLPAYAVNRTKRLIKSPKLYWGDTGVALHLAGAAEPAGAHLENLVLHDLLAWRDARLERAEICYWRTAIGEEVDFVIEAGGSLLPDRGQGHRAAAPGRRRAPAHLPAPSTASGRAPGCCCTPAARSSGWRRDVLAAPWWRVLLRPSTRPARGCDVIWISGTHMNAGRSPA